MQSLVEYKMGLLSLKYILQLLWSSLWFKRFQIDWPPLRCDFFPNSHVEMSNIDCVIISRVGGVGGGVLFFFCNPSLNLIIFINFNRFKLETGNRIVDSSVVLDQKQDLEFLRP